MIAGQSSQQPSDANLEQFSQILEARFNGSDPQAAKEARLALEALQKDSLKFIETVVAFIISPNPCKPL